MNRKITEESDKYPRTVSKELFAVWNQYRRTGDGQTIADALGYSRPVIDRALNFGHVKAKGLSDQISKFFSKRLTDERQTAQEMVNQLTQTT